MSWGISTKQNNEILDFIEANPVCGIIAPTGSGKSTSMIEKIYKDGGAERVFITEPTIPAARGLAMTMKSKLGNDIVGFAAEGVIQYRQSTPIVYCTSGHLRKKILGYFENGKVASTGIDFCSVLVIDEAHSGSLDNDVIIDLWRTAVEQGATVPRLILASATLSKDVSGFEDLPVIEIKTKNLPVDIQYHNQDYNPDSKNIYTDLALVISNKHMSLPVKELETSKWLVFCPGSSEVELICSLLRDFQMDKVKIYPAYSELPKEQIDAIFENVELGYRSIIIATNIAEASITIDGLDAVFDSLNEKISETSSSGGVRLVLTNISKSSASQRKGRTGRTRTGFCYRMCTEGYYDKLAEQRAPEIMRVPLTGVITELLNVGINPKELFKFRVSKKRMDETLSTLKTLKMIDKTNNVTELGNFATRFQLGVQNAAIIYNWMKNEKFPVYPIIALVCIIDCYGPSYYFYPKKKDDMTAREYDKFKEKYYDEKFEKFEGGNDIESMLKMWNFMVENLGGLDTGFNQVAEFCKNNSLNNKKIQELIKVVKHTAKVIATLYGKDFAVGPFNERKAFRVAEPYIKDAYYKFIFKNAKDANYINESTGEYFRLDKRQSVNIKYKQYPEKIIGFRTLENLTSGKKSSNTISLFVGTF
jgi:HrpA-like RNA helicase